MPSDMIGMEFMPSPAESAKSGNAAASAMMWLRMFMLSGNAGSRHAAFHELLALVGSVCSVVICCA